MMHDKQTHEASEKQRKEKELSRVKIKKEDVDLIVSYARCRGISLASTVAY